MTEVQQKNISAAAIIIFAAAATGLAMSGCAGSASISSVVDPIAQAARFSELAPGFKVAVSEVIMPPNLSEAVTASGTGIFDRRDKRGTFKIEINVKEHTSAAESQYADGAMYMRLPNADQSSATHGKPWIKFDLNSVDSALGINDLAVSGSTESSNPSQYLSYLRATGARAMKIGVERVQGMPTTHYRATIDYEQYANRVPPAQRMAARESVSALERLTGSHTQVVDVWLDGRHRVRREAFTYRECLPGVQGVTMIHTKIEFFDFGEQVIPGLPARSEVADLTQDIVKKLRNVKFGCS